MEKWWKTSTNQNSTIFLKVQQTLLFKRKTCSQQFFNPNWNLQALTLTTKTSLNPQNIPNKNDSSSQIRPNITCTLHHRFVSEHIYQQATAIPDTIPVCCSCSDDKHISSFQKLNYLLCPVPICHTRLPCSGEFYRPAEEEPLCILRGC